MNRIGMLALLGVLLVCSHAQAISYSAFEQVTVAASAVGFTGTKINPAGLPQATTASCRLETAEVRWTLDGTVPTSTVGTLLEIGDTIVIAGNDSIAKFRAIRTTATSGVLDCTYTAQ